MISVICVYNDEEILKDYLISSLHEQRCQYEPILVDNTSNSFSSAAEALNHGASIAKGDYLMFVHQDVSFKDSGFLERILKSISSMPKNTIAGAAGVQDARGVLSSITHGYPPVPAGDIVINSAQSCQTLDEVLFICPRTLFDELRFDSSACPGWHLYVVDFCLSAYSKGYRAFVLPMDIYHKSSGYSMNKGYYTALEKVSSKHKGTFRTIYTTMGVWPTSKPELKFCILLTRARSWIWRRFHPAARKTFV